MKKVLLPVLVLIGMISQVYASHPLNKGPVVSDAQCKYKLADARADLKNLVPTSFSINSQSEDGNIQIGTLSYHNPTNKDEQSVDAMVLVLQDKREPDKQLTLVVAYFVPKQTVYFKREIRGDKKILGPCFEKSVENSK